METLNSERPDSNYRCSQGDLYTASETIATSYTDHSANFIGYSSLYTATTGTDLLAAIASARAMPDEATRKAEHSVLRKGLDTQRVNCLVKWQQLSSYIRDGFEPEFYNDLLNAAGHAYYESALGGNWDAVRSLMDSAVTLIVLETAALTTGGMPASFEADMAAQRDTFATIHGNFLQSEEASKQGTDAKVTANNAIYREVMRICEDGKRIFRNEGAIREQFVFERVLDLVRNLQSGHGVLGTITDVGTGGLVGQAGLLLERLEDDGTYTEVGTMLSTNDGTYKFNGVPNGTYRLRVDKDGYERQEAMLTVNNGPVVVDFALSVEA